MVGKGLAKATLSALLGKDASRIDVGDAKLVTFDVFDTLVRRSCGNPEEVFVLVGREAELRGLVGDGGQFRAMRVAAESAARKAAGANNEITLEDIYACMALPNSGDVRQLIELELACELVVCVPNPRVMAVYDELRQLCEVAIVSDTYLPTWFVRMVLDSCGVQGYSGLYVSSEYGVMKRDGRLHEIVIGDWGIAPSEVLHIGDHPLADYLAPKRMGMRAFLVANGSNSGSSMAAATRELGQGHEGDQMDRDLKAIDASAEMPIQDENLVELQNVIFGILQAVVDVCELNSIPYYLVEGSCLGAVRHAGIIPWDDDIDMAIPATMHKKLEDAINADVSSPYRAVRAFSAEGEELIRILDTAVEVQGGLFEDTAYVNPMLDVFLLCGLPDGRFGRAIHYARVRARHKLYKLSDPSMILERKRGPVGTVAVAVARRIGKTSILSRSRELAKLEELMCKYEFADSQEVFCLTWYGSREIMPASHYGTGRECEFNGMRAMIPVQAERYLERLYGDYMQLPPAEERQPKHSYEIVVRG